MCDDGVALVVCRLLWAFGVAVVSMYTKYEPYLGAFLLVLCFYVQIRKISEAVAAAVGVMLTAHYVAVFCWQWPHNAFPKPVYPVFFWSTLVVLAAATAFGIARWRSRTGVPGA
jgi:hypothetical protein